MQGSKGMIQKDNLLVQYIVEKDFMTAIMTAIMTLMIKAKIYNVSTHVND